MCETEYTVYNTEYVYWIKEKLNWIFIWIRDGVPTHYYFWEYPIVFNFSSNCPHMISDLLKTPSVAALSLC